MTAAVKTAQRAAPKPRMRAMKAMKPMKGAMNGARKTSRRAQLVMKSAMKAAVPKPRMKAMRAMKPMKAVARTPMKSIKTAQATPQKIRRALVSKPSEKESSKATDCVTSSTAGATIPEMSGGQDRSDPPEETTPWVGEDGGKWVDYKTACYNCGEQGHLARDCQVDKSTWIGRDGIKWQEEWQPQEEASKD